MDDADPAARLDRLLGPDGQALLAEVAAAGPDPGTELRLAGRLRARYPAELVSAALALHGLRVRARAKFARAGSLYLTRDGLEQASAEPVARHRAARLAGSDPGPLADLCCGIGGDLVALAGCAPAGRAPVLAVDRDPLHLRMAALNAAAYDRADRVRTACADVRDADLTGVATVFVDPARRAGGVRRRTGDGEPPLAWCAGLAGRRHVVVKAAPGLDPAAVPAGWELEFVAVGRELKEAVLWSPGLARAPRRATVLPAGPPSAPVEARELTARPGDPVACAAPGEYLLDPSPAVTRAGLVEDLARGLDAWKIDPMIAFLSADRPLRSPFGRSLRVLDSGPWKQRELAGRLRALGIGSVDVRRRGLAGDVDALRKGLKLPPGRAATLVMTRVHDRPWALVCEDLASAG
jgi:hypothetical protein